MTPGRWCKTVAPGPDSPAYLSGRRVVKWPSRVVAFGGCVGVLDLALRAGARAYFGPRPWVSSGAGDEMFDGVIPLGEALRPLDLSRRSTRVACRQRGFGSRPRRIGVSEGLTRAKGRWKVVVVVGRSGLAGTRCHTAQPKPGSSGQSIRALSWVAAGSLLGGLPLDARRAAALPAPERVCSAGGARASSPSSRNVW